MPAFEHDGRVSFVPDHLRLRAEALLRVDPGATDEALALLDRAVAVAREHGAGSFELRSALTAARVLRERGARTRPGPSSPMPTPATPRGSTTPTCARRAPTWPDPTQRNEGATMDWTPLAKALQGHLVLPGDPTYDLLRVPFNARVNAKPAAIARCVSEKDVVQCVTFAKANRVSITCRSGGHGAEGYCSVDGELMIDQSAMQQVRVDTENKVVLSARARPGARWTSRRTRAGWRRRAAAAWRSASRG